MLHELGRGTKISVRLIAVLCYGIYTCTCMTCLHITHVVHRQCCLYLMELHQYLLQLVALRLGHPPERERERGRGRGREREEGGKEEGGREERGRV